MGGRVEYQNGPVEIDTKSLAEIAAKTGGEFYRATNTEKLMEVYQQIDQLEKTKMKVTNFSKHYEAFLPFLFAALLCLLTEITLRHTLLRRIP